MIAPFSLIQFSYSFYSRFKEIIACELVFNEPSFKMFKVSIYLSLRFTLPEKDNLVSFA